MFGRSKRSIDEAIEDLMHRYGNDVLRIAYVYLKDYQLAEDAFQEVFLKVYKHYNTFQAKSSVKTWLIRITINVCKDMLRKNWLQQETMVEDQWMQQIKDEQNDIMDLVDQKSLFEAILKLEAKYKDVIILYYYQGYKIEEIASILETTVGNVSSMLSRARTRLKNILTEARWYDE